MASSLHSSVFKIRAIILLIDAPINRDGRNMVTTIEKWSKPERYEL